MSSRPLVAIPGRFSASASALRHRAIVTARLLSAAVLQAGGEPLTVHPWAPRGRISVDEVAERLAFADAVLLPGGGDLHPATYAEHVASHETYDIDPEQDAFDLAVAAWALEHHVPLLAICRGLQVVNVQRGGSLRQHMDAPHRHVVHDVTIAAGTRLSAAVGDSITASCYHHQAIDRLGEGLTVVARAADESPEGVELAGVGGWFLGVQWHPEDTVESDPKQLAIFQALIAAAS